jgi:flavorubredoxin
MTNPYAPVVPATRTAPIRVTPDTYLIRALYGEATPTPVYINSMVIAGREPVIVDTGTVGNRKQWLEDVFGIVDPEDVRWVFISHDDHDHTGNLIEAMQMCPNATLVTTWFQMERLAGDLSVPLTRMRWVGDGEAFDAGDRLLAAIRPPVFDSPTTRGLYDSKSRVYWAGDCFATPLQGINENTAEIDHEFWKFGFNTFQSAISPWHELVDPAKYNKQIDRIAELDLRAVLSAHSPVTDGARLQEAIEMLRDLPFQEASKLPDQAVLDELLASLVSHAA